MQRALHAAIRAALRAPTPNREAFIGRHLLAQHEGYSPMLPLPVPLPLPLPPDATVAYAAAVCGGDWYSGMSRWAVVTVAAGREDDDDGNTAISPLNPRYASTNATAMADDMTTHRGRMRTPRDAEADAACGTAPGAAAAVSVSIAAASPHIAGSSTTAVTNDRPTSIAKTASHPKRALTHAATMPCSTEPSEPLRALRRICQS